MFCFLSLLLDSILWPWLSTQTVCSRCNRTWKPVLPVSLSCTVNTLNQAGTKAQSHLSSSLTEEQPKHGICMFRLQLLLSTWTNGFSWIEAMEQQVVDGLWNSLNKSCKHATVVIFYGFYWDSTLDTQESLLYIIELKDTNLYVVDLDGFGKTFRHPRISTKMKTSQTGACCRKRTGDPCHRGAVNPHFPCAFQTQEAGPLLKVEKCNLISPEELENESASESSMGWVVVVPTSQEFQWQMKVDWFSLGSPSKKYIWLSWWWLLLGRKATQSIAGSYNMQHPNSMFGAVLSLLWQGLARMLWMLVVGMLVFNGL